MRRSWRHHLAVGLGLLLLAGLALALLAGLGLHALRGVAGVALAALGLAGVLLLVALLALALGLLLGRRLVLRGHVEVEVLQHLADGVGIGALVVGVRAEGVEVLEDAGIQVRPPGIERRPRRGRRGHAGHAAAAQGLATGLLDRVEDVARRLARRPVVGVDALVVVAQTDGVRIGLAAHERNLVLDELAPGQRQPHLIPRHAAAAAGEAHRHLAAAADRPQRGAGVALEALDGVVAAAHLRRRPSSLLPRQTSVACTPLSSSSRPKQRW